MPTELQQLLHITHASQDEAWVQGVLVPALGLTDDQYWTRAEADPAALKLEELEHAVKSCRYTLLVVSSAARVDQWAQFAAQLAQHLGIEEGKPRLLLVARDFEPKSERARELLPLGQRCLVCLDCSDPERTTAALARLKAQLAVTTTPEPPTECPYPGLRTFGEGGFNRPDLFFGRDEEGRAIVEKVRGGGRVLLVGPSGCGKSSLVRALVLPALRQGSDAMAIAVTHPGALPDVELRKALDKLDLRLGPATDAYLEADDKQAALPALVAATAGSRRLLHLDQLEEVFLDDVDEHGERARFFARLAALGRVPDLAILLGMRADFYGDLMRSPAWDDFKDHRIELAPLRGAALRLAITRPAEMVGVHVEADLIERLVREAALDCAAEALPLLQVALVQLWALREWRYLSLASYAQLADGERRGLEVVLARHADTSIGMLVGPAQVLARRVLIDLVHLGEGRPDTRRRRTERELRRAGDDGDAVSQVLDHLSERRLIVVGAEASAVAAVHAVALLSADGEPELEERHVDLAHDTLITGWPALAGWLAKRRDDLRTQRRLEARAAGGGLLATSELPEFTRWVAWITTPAGQALGATEALRKLVRRSVAAQRLLRRAFGAGLVVVTAFAIVFGLQALRLRDEKAKTQRSIRKVAETANLIVFQIEEKLQTVAGASSVREKLLKHARELLAELRKLGELDERDQRTAMASRLHQADFALERGRLKEAHALYLEVLQDAQRRAATDGTHTLWQYDVHVAYARIGNVAIKSGRPHDARGWFEKALAVSKALAAADPANTRLQNALAMSYINLGDVGTASGKLDDAWGWFEKALVMCKALVAADPANAEWQRDLGSSYERIGYVTMKSGKLDAARGWFEKSLAVREALTAADFANTAWQRDLAGGYSQLGDMAMRSDKLDDARLWYEKELAVSKILAAADPANAEWQRDLGSSYERIGYVTMKSGKLDEARGWFEKSLAVHKALTAADSANTTWQRDLAVSYERLGEVAMATGKIDGARAWFEKAVAVRKTLTAVDPDNTVWQSALVETYKSIGDVAVASGRLDDARAWFEKLLAVSKALAAADPANSAWQRDLAVSYDRLGNVAAASGKLDDARAWFEQLLAVRKILAAADRGNAGAQRDLLLSYLTVARALATQP